MRKRKMVKRGYQRQNGAENLEKTHREKTGTKNEVVDDPHSSGAPECGLITVNNYERRRAPADSSLVQVIRGRG